VVVGLLGLALLLRIAVVVAIHDSYVPLNDALHFDEIATSVANGDGYGDHPIPPATGTGSFRAPLYPAVLGAVYLVAGDHSWTAGLLANAVIGTVAVALIGLVASLLWSRRVGAIALALAAVSPTLILVGTSLQLEPLLVALSFGALAAVLQHRRAPAGLTWPIVAGVLIGLATLTREVAVAFLPSLAWLLWSSRPASTPRWSGRALAAPALVVLVAVVTVAPWTARNADRYDAFIPVSSSSGFGLAGTFNDVAMDDRGQWLPPYNVPHLADVMLALDDPDEADVDRALRRESIEFVKEHPAYVPQLAFWGSVRLFDLDGGAYDRKIARFVPYSQRLTWISIAGTYVYLALAVVGAFSPLARKAPLAVWAIPVLAYLGIALTLPANVRYRASIEPFTVLLAALALVPVVEKLLAPASRGSADDDDAVVAEPVQTA